MGKKPCTEIEMYLKPTPGQLSFEDFYLPFGGKLSGQNRWITLSNLIPWEKFETEYAELFSKGIGSPAKSFRMALGALIIKERLGTSDVKTVEQIRENPYLQFFLGLSEYSDKAPFEASMMVHFRKRLTLEIIGRMNEEIVSQSNKRLKEESSEKVVSSGEEQENSQGKECLNEKSEIYRQQQSMYDQNVQRIDDRIVSQAQPHVRPIVRGKAGTPVEFGAKISVSCADGKVFLDRLSWDNFNESGDLQKQIEEYKERYGYYPKSVHVDQIYRTRVNRAYCKERSIRISGPPLGRPKKQEEEQSAIRKQALEDNRVRNQIEGKFGQAKRRFSLGLIKSKLSETAETSIAITFLVMNLEQVLHLFFVFGEMASSFWRFLSSIKISQAKKLKRELLFI